MILVAMMSPSLSNKIERFCFLMTFEMIGLKLYEFSRDCYNKVVVRLLREFYYAGVGELDWRLCFNVNT